MRKLAGLVSVALLAGILSGCTTYYEIKDPASSATYYTTKIKKEKSGTIMFTDEKTKGEITLQSSNIMEISSDAYDAAVGK